MLSLTLQAVTLVAGQQLAEGQEVALADGRPNGELLLATGARCWSGWERRCLPCMLRPLLWTDVLPPSLVLAR